MIILYSLYKKKKNLRLVEILVRRAIRQYNFNYCRTVFVRENDYSNKTQNGQKTFVGFLKYATTAARKRFEIRSRNRKRFIINDGHGEIA